MPTITRNVPLTGEWEEINFTHCSNPSQTPIEFWPGTIVPETKSKGHLMNPGGGLEKSIFDDPDVTVRFRGAGAILTVTESI